MKNFVQKGEVFLYENGTGNTIASGAVVISGNLVGIAAADILDGESGPVNICGVYELPKKASLALGQGEACFWDATPGEVTGTAADGSPIGIVFKEADSADTTILVLLSKGRSGIADNVAAVTTADGSDLATTQALANQLKDSVNDILTNLKAAGLMATA